MPLPKPYEADRKTEPQYSEDDMYWLSLAEDVANGKMSDAGANQAWLEYINHKTEPTISKMEQVEDETRLTAKCLNCANGGSYKCSKCDGEMYYKYDKDELQTEEHCETCKHKDECDGATYEYRNTEWWCLGYAPIEDEPQTDCKECEYVWWNSEAKRYECSIEKCPYSQTERSSE